MCLVGLLLAASVGGCDLVVFGKRATVLPAQTTSTPSPSSRGTGSASPAGPDAALRTPDPESAEGKAIVAAVVERIDTDLGFPTTVRIDQMSVQDGFALISGTPRTAAGEPIDYKKTAYAEAVKQGAFDDGVLALLAYENGAWTVLEFELGATDFPGEYWIEKRQAPTGLLGR